MTLRRSGEFVRACIAIAACLLALCPEISSPGALVLASSPVIAVAPEVNLPHGLESITGSGFDPGAQVDLSVQSTDMTSTLGILVADASGSIRSSITLPYTLDAGLANMVIAHEPGSAVSASASVTGAAVMPTAGNGLQISANPGDTLHLHVVGFAPRDPLAILVGGQPALMPPGISQYVTDPTGTAISDVCGAGFRTTRSKPDRGERRSSRLRSG